MNRKRKNAEKKRRVKYSTYKSKYRPKYYFREKEIDFTKEEINYEQFLLQEFFNAELENLNKIFKYYEKEHGPEALSYLKRKYREWANGNYHLTKMMIGRIISIMPYFLSEEGKHKLALHDFMASIKKTVKKFWEKPKNKPHQKAIKKSSTINEIINEFEQEYYNIEELNLPEFRFNLLNKDEKDEAREIIKFILKTKLQKEFDKIEKDFNTFLPFMPKFNKGKFNANYEMSFFNKKCQISNLQELSEIKIPKFRIPEISNNSRFKRYADKYLAYELMLMETSHKKAIASSFLNDYDLKLFYTYYTAISQGGSEAEINSYFQGEGGILRLKSYIKPLSKIKKSILYSASKLLFYFTILLVLVIWLVKEDMFLSLIFGGFFLGIFFYNFMSEEFDELKSLKEELKQYG
jgi:hypothetical protein